MADKTTVNFYTGSSTAEQLKRIDARTVKAIYESNEDTEAFTTAFKEYLLELINGTSDEYYTKDQIDESTNITLTIKPLLHGSVLYYSNLEAMSQISIVCVDTATNDNDATVMAFSALDASPTINFFGQATIKAVVNATEKTITFDTVGFDSDQDRFELYLYAYYSVIDGGEF